MEIESRKDKDHFFDSLGGWNSDDRIGKKQAKKDAKQRKKDEKAIRKQRREEFKMINMKNELLEKPK